MLFTIDDPFKKEEQLSNRQREQLQILDYITENIREDILSGKVSRIDYKTKEDYQGLMWRTE